MISEMENWEESHWKNPIADTGTPINRRRTGTAYEQRAKEHLEKQGYHILEKNYRCAFGEIDLIGTEEDTLCFIEVKYRSGVRYGTASEAVTPSKQKTIRRVASWYLLQKNKQYQKIRFDVAAIDRSTITLFRNAF